MHYAGEDSSARIGEDGIKKCKTGVSPFSTGKTMEEVSAGFGVAFPGEYESGDFEEDYDDINDDLFVLLPPLSSFTIRHSTTGQRHSCQMKTIFKVVNNYVDHFHSLSLCFCKMSFLLHCSIIIYLYKPSLFFCYLLLKALCAFL